MLICGTITTIIGTLGTVYQFINKITTKVAPVPPPPPLSDSSILGGEKNIIISEIPSLTSENDLLFYMIILLFIGIILIIFSIIRIKSNKSSEQI